MSFDDAAWLLDMLLVCEKIERFVQGMDGAAFLGDELRQEAILRQLVGHSRRIHSPMHLVTQLGLPLAETARQLGVSTAGIAKAVARAEQPWSVNQQRPATLSQQCPATQFSGRFEIEGSRRSW